MHLKDEIAKRALHLLKVSSKMEFGTEDQLYGYVKLGDYDLHWQGGYGAGGREHAESARQGLRTAMVLDDLASI